MDPDPTDFIGTLIGLNSRGIDLTSVALLGSAPAVGLGFGPQNVVAPNSAFINGRGVNWTLGDAYRPHAHSLWCGLRQAQGAGEGVGHCGRPRHSGRGVENASVKGTVWRIASGENNMDGELVVWADRALSTRPGSAHAELMWALDQELQERGIEIPLPQRDLHMRSGTLDARMVAAQDPAQS